jgi:ABC-type nitrate/sulfonate/bicarbonate transport system substrate-binding protein
LLSFVPDAQFVNAYLANDLGYTTKCNLDIKLQHLNGSQNATQLLATGKVQYAQLDPFQYTAAVAKGVPIVAIAEDIAETPFVFLALAKSGINSPKDFPGHTVGTQAGADNQWYLEKMLSETVSPNDAKRVKQVPAGFDLQPFLAGKIDVFPFFAADATLAAARQKTKINEIFAADYGIHTPGNVIATTLKTLKNNPTQVKHFLAAEMAGTQASTQAANRPNGIKAVKSRIGAKVSDKILGSLYNEWGKYRSSTAWSKNTPGWNVFSSYDQAQQFMRQHGVIKDKVPISKLYTNAVLRQIGSGGRVKPLSQVCGG